MKTEKGIKVLLVYPNPTMDNLIPIGVSLLSACLKKAGHRTKLFDTTFYDSGKKIGEHYREKNLQVLKTDLKKVGIKRLEGDITGDFKKMVEEYKPDLVAVSAFEIGYLQGLSLLKSIKDFKAIRLVGGIHTTFSADEVIREDCVDMVCVGEGEGAIVELADKIRDKKDLTKIKNIWVKKNNRIIRNDLRPLKNLDELPFQDWEIYDKKRLYKPFLGGIVATAAIETSRGCMSQCSYCCNPVLQKMYKRKGCFFRLKSIERIIDEIKYLKKKYNIGFIKFVDADFLAKSDKDFRKFVRMYKKIKIPFWAEAKAGNVTEEKAKLLEEVGCRGFAIGIESGNEKIRNQVLKKDVSKQDIINAFNIFKKRKNLRICANIMIGLPYEARKEIFDTIRLCKKLDIDNPIVNIFNPYRGTEMRDLCVRKGYISKDKLAGDFRGEYVLSMPQITKEELLGLQRTFPLYVKFSKITYPLIRSAERNNAIFNFLSKIYSKKYLTKKQIS